MPDIPKRKNTSDRLPQKLNPIELLVKQFTQSTGTHIGCSQRQNKRYLIESKPAISPNLRQELIEQIYREDILELQDLIQRDLSHWLK